MKLTSKLPSSVRGNRLALTAIVVTAVVSALHLSFNMGYHYELLMCTHPSPPYPSSFRQFDWALSFEGDNFLLVTLALVFSAVGIWSRRVLGFLLSLIALICVAGIYILWYLRTLSIMELFNVRNFSSMQDQQQHLLPLYNATWWDLVVLGVALIVFVWQVAMLRRALKPTAIISENLSAAKSD